jgi:hypothetical protein
MHFCFVPDHTASQPGSENLYFINQVLLSVFPTDVLPRKPITFIIVLCVCVCVYGRDSMRETSGKLFHVPGSVECGLL